MARSRVPRPRARGAVLPVLHLNGYKIANPTVLSRLDQADLSGMIAGHGWRPVVVAGSDPFEVHEAYAAAPDDCLDEIQHDARHGSRRGPAR